jgi:inosine-uridine nucleoside N-ribohydrolase
MQRFHYYYEVDGRRVLPLWDAEAIAYLSRGRMNQHRRLPLKFRHVDSLGRTVKCSLTFWKSNPMHIMHDVQRANFDRRTDGST